MRFYDIFNGDADGLCGLRQLRLAHPRDAHLITGVKRDIALLERVTARSGDYLTVLDISLLENHSALLRALEAGAHCQWFDHHFPGEIPRHAGLDAHIDYAPGTCTSLIVDKWLAGTYRAWAVTAAFGDNLATEAACAAQPLGLDAAELDTLRALGECLNYNAYGERAEDLRFHPADLYRRLERFEHPLDFAARDPAFDQLRTGLEADLALALSTPPRTQTARTVLVVLPDEAWSRRVSGTLANRLASGAPDRAHAVAVPSGNAYTVSVRAPISRPTGADALCRGFASGGGRPAAAGINALPAADLPRFENEFARAFGAVDGPATSP